MHPVVRDEVFRIGYEAIRNACVHSRGSRIKVELTYAHDLTVRVEDNGVGIDCAVLDQGKDGHFGLQGMRERAARILEGDNLLDSGIRTRNLSTFSCDMFLTLVDMRCDILDSCLPVAKRDCGPLSSSC